MAAPAQKPVEDSLRHTFGFSLSEPSDVPEDFPISIPVEEWKCAMFIPGDSFTRWRKPKYPPRIYVLTEKLIAALAHPDSHFESFCADLSSLTEISCYRALLHGELQFRTEHSDSGRLLYGAVQHKFVDPYLRTLSALWLTHKALPELSPIEHHVHRADTRCLAALHIELHQGTETLLQFSYQPSFSRRSERSLYIGHEQVSARLLALTDLRLLLVNEGPDELEDQHGVRLRWLPLDALVTVEREPHQERHRFTLVFRGEVPRMHFWLEDENEISAMESILSALGHSETQGVGM